MRGEGEEVSETYLLLIGPGNKLGSDSASFPQGDSGHRRDACDEHQDARALGSISWTASRIDATRIAAKLVAQGIGAALEVDGSSY